MNHPLELIAFARPLNYQFALRLQRKLVDLRLEQKVSDTVLSLEHTPCITLGPKATPFESPLPIVVTNRGGKATYHGPGQLILYPILKLKKKDLQGYLRTLEHALIRTLKILDLQCHTQPDIQSSDPFTGIWIGNKKLASIGIAVTRWVTYHGISINITNSLEPFAHFNPCGFDPGVMTRLIDLPGLHELDFLETRKLIENQFLLELSQLL